MRKRVSLFKVLQRELGPSLITLGFVQVPQAGSERSHILMYFKDTPRDRALGLWFQRNVKASFVDARGSSFTFEFFRSRDNPYGRDGRERSYFLLAPPELEEMRELQNRVIARLPPLDSVLQPYEIELFGHSLERDYQMITEPFNPRHERWMRYRDEADILAWTSFIDQLLPGLIGRFESAKPPQA
jgi:hypothetical protein